MNRRALLESVGLAGASLAGCVAPSGTETVESATETPASARVTESEPSTATATAPPSDTATATDTATPEPVTPAPDDPIAVRLDNGGPAVTVSVTVTGDDVTLLEETVELATDEHRELDTGIDTTGEFTLTVNVQDGPARSYGLSIEPYDVRKGSNAIVRIGYPDLPEEIMIFVEE